MSSAHARVAELPQPGPVRVHAVFWNALGRGSVAYALTEMLDNMPETLVRPTLWFLGGQPLSHRSYHQPALPKWAYRLLCKFGASPRAQGALAGSAMLREIHPGDIVYIWPPYDLRLIRRAQARGAIVVAERTNCMAEMGRKVLVEAFARRGRPLPEGWYPAIGISEELQQMRQCDYITAPNPLVTQSLLDAGIPASKILDTFYGFDPVRLAPAIGIDRPERSPVFAFVGLGIVRKGLDVLLEAWAQAGVEGTLMIAGEVDDDIRRDYVEILSRPDVQLLGHIRDIASVYAAADVFVFPTHEEGGPQVIYEAAGCGLPSIVSPMGTGRIVRDGHECLIINPLEVTELTDAIERLAKDAHLRRVMGHAAAERAKAFTWSSAGLSLGRQFAAIAASSGPKAEGSARKSALTAG